MILLLLAWFYKKILAIIQNKEDYNKIQEVFKYLIFRLALIILVLLCFSLCLYPQEHKYVILKNNDSVGNITVSRILKDYSMQLTLLSQVNTRLLFEIKMITKEKSHFKNGILTYTSVSKEMNGRRKLNREIKCDEKGCSIYESGQVKQLETVPITNNVLLLYFNEPVNQSKVFSENFKKWLDIIKSGLNQYKLILPDGNYNEYIYEKGICKKVVVHNTFFTATFQLINE